MSVPRTIPYLAVAVIAGLTLSARSQTAAAQDKPAIVGTWTLDEDKTEEPRDRTIADVQSTGGDARTGLGSRRRTTGSGGGGRSGGGAARGGGGGGRGGRGAFGRMFGGMMNASATLKIMQADSVIMIDDEDGPIFVNLHADGKTTEEKMADQTILKTKAEWKKNDLVIERSHEVNGSARMIFKLDAKNPKVMTVEFHFENKRQRRTIDQKRVYNLPE